MKKILFLAITTMLFSCSDAAQEQKEIAVETKEEVTTKTADDTQTAIQNFAVIWKWATDDVKLVEDNTLTFADEMNGLWKSGIIENVYYNNDAKVDKFEYFPNISLFTKASSIEEAKSNLNRLTLVKKGICTYDIYPVGTKWMGRNDAAAKKYSKSYVAVWSTEIKSDTKALIEANAKAQTDALVALWNSGDIENVYFDIEGIQKTNKVTDFVFFVNANSEADAKKICDNLPFVQKHIATYKMVEVGTFWLGNAK